MESQLITVIEANFDGDDEDIDEASEEENEDHEMRVNERQEKRMAAQMELPPCYICKKAFSTKSALIKHIR